ncbi:MAG: phosphoenolpyruvate carboxykinase [Dehalococcoidia bacterium]|nr:phosphoenolpyruvate carboxykinase [Dehalococcoidia bacterium]
MGVGLARRCTVVSLQTRSYELEARAFIDNPSYDELARLTAEMPNAKRTVYGSADVFTRVDARSSASTYIVTDDPDSFRGLQTMTRAEYDAVAGRQDAYVREQEMIVIDGEISNAPEVRTPARLIIERRNANVAGMQKYLYFDKRTAGEPEVTVIDTPNLVAPGFPNDRCIAVDLDRGVTRVLNSDYFGESKKGGLRMWNTIVYTMGGLAMHAGCKVIPVAGAMKTIVIIGLSGTGKTTTTFQATGGAKPVQDDFIAWMPDGRVHGSEDGCFAKTFALSEETEPEIYRATISSGAYLENVYRNDDGTLDFFNESFTQNGRAVFPLSALGRFEDARTIPPVSAIVILNRATSVVPAIARLTMQQAAAYFMLGETQGTSAGGAAEAGKALRVPGTNPFFPMPNALQGNRFLDLLRAHPVDVYVMNTGWVVEQSGPGSKKVKVAHSSACVQAIAEGGVEWDDDPDFGYQLPAHIPGIAHDDEDLLHPRARYVALGRLDDYRAQVAKLKAERIAFLHTFPLLDPFIAEGLG